MFRLSEGCRIKGASDGAVAIDVVVAGKLNKDPDPDGAPKKDGAKPAGGWEVAEGVGGDNIAAAFAVASPVKSRSRAAACFTLSQTRSVQRLQAFVKHFTSKFHSNNTA